MAYIGILKHADFGLVKPIWAESLAELEAQVEENELIYVEEVPEWNTEFHERVKAKLRQQGGEFFI